MNADIATSTASPAASGQRRAVSLQPKFGLCKSEIDNGKVAAELHCGGMRDFKHIKAWQRAHALGIAIHKLASGFTRAGAARLRAQLTAAADSIAENIVEGCGAATNKEFARFLDISIKSANEAEHHLLNARDRMLISPDEWQKNSAETIEIRKMIYSYREKVLKGD